MKITRHKLQDGYRIPKYYGIAYRDFDTDTYVIAIIPFNILIRLWRIIWWFFKHGISSLDSEAMYYRGYKLGIEFEKRNKDLRIDNYYNVGYRTGYDNGYRDRLEDE